MEVSEKKNQILKVAEKLFAEKGFDGTSIRTIAKEAEINIAMISYYFGSKEKLLEEILYYRVSDFKMKLETIISKDINYLQKADEIVAFTVKRIHRNRRIYKIVNFEYSNRNRQIDFESYLNQKRENYAVIENFVKEGQQAGIFSKNINIQLVIPTILGTYFHFYYNKPFFQMINNLNEETSIDNYVHTILTKHIQQTIKALLTYEI